MRSNQILISIIIPVKNGGFWLTKTLDSIFNQTLINQSEVIIIDSGSTDETLQIISRYPVKLLTITSSEFNHGGTRNIGVKEASGKYVVLTVQDAEPVDQYWLENMLRCIEQDNAAGVCGQQIVPHDYDKNPVQWFRPISQPIVERFYYSKREDFVNLSPSEKLSACKWDNVNAMYRKEVLLKFPFPEVPFAEDALWCKQILENGYSIAYTPFAKVNHYHYQYPKFTLKRQFIEHYYHYRYFGFTPAKKENIVVGVLRDLKIICPMRSMGLKNKIKWLWYNFNVKKARRKAFLLFVKTLEKGDGELNKLYNTLCNEVPQAVNPENN